MSIPSRGSIWPQIAQLVSKQPITSAADCVVIRRKKAGGAIHIWPLVTDRCVVIFQNGRRFIAWRVVPGNVANVCRRYRAYLQRMVSTSSQSKEAR